ncbi:filamin-A-like isoform X1 [Gigantopelta aegis]|uniref:filamin-A-like isoform X1 n=1 Tax=Gigantopelta aegis TaxID=1735272 RepID=UPI001B88E5DC|nr:filamin-A-like isoform X1 [Gigantopelta aegis]
MSIHTSRVGYCAILTNFWYKCLPCVKKVCIAVFSYSYSFSTNKMPSGAHLGPQVRDNNDGSICVEYQPKARGRHEIQMSYDGAPVEGSPFSCVVDAIDGGFVTAFGQGLVGGSSGQETEFTVVAQKGTARDISIGIEGPNKVDVKRDDKSDGSTHVTYVPMQPGAYNISIKYKSKHIKDSPFNAKVSGEGRKRVQFSISNSSEYSLKVIEADIVDLVGTIKSPKGQTEPCILKKLSNGELAIASFTPHEQGDFVISVYRGEKHIKNSPFKVHVGDKEMGHAGKVSISGATSKATANKSNELIIDTTGAGYGGLGLSIEGPHRSDIDCVHVEGRKYTIHYSPHEPGIYILNVRFADDHIQGSPFLIAAEGSPSGRLRETITREMKSAQAVEPNKMCQFILCIPGTNPFDMEASVADPDGTVELCDVIDEDDFHYLIQFTPKVTGVHTLSVKHKSLHISGSPFQYTVGQLSMGGYHKVQVGGPGLERGEVGRKNVFNIYTREAGPGTLTVAVEGVSKAEIKLEDRPNGFLGAIYTVTKPGMYGIHVKFNDQHIPTSPFMVNVAPDSGVAKQVTIQSLRDRGLEIGKAATFSVAFNGAKGKLHVTVRTPTGSMEDCMTQEMDTGLYGCRFIPKENGVHYLDIRLDDAHIPDSPFAIMVGSMAADAAMVTADGEGLDHGKCAAKAKFEVKTAGAGSGILAVMIEGPSKVAINCREVDEGYEFSYTPFAAGKYLITIKYGNIPIAGSPYQAEITGSGRKPSPLTEQSSMVVETVEKKVGAHVKKHHRGDASKVTAKGPGLKRAFTNRNLNVTIDTREAGQAVLCVGMIAPSGMPEPELQIKKLTNTSFQISYKVQEIGEHVLHIKWGEEDIPGSPFVLNT